MKPVILLVEDDPQIQMNTKMILEFNGYQPLTAMNGKEALEILSKLEKPPDFIISDILMPEMNGYDFFLAVSNNPNWQSIPFIFLSAKSTPEDVRFGKTLGVDDYITKPFDKEDLLAVIAGKLTRSIKTRSLAKQIEKQLLSTLKIDLEPSITEEQKQYLCIFFVRWDETLGPELQAFYPEDLTPPFDHHRLTMQLFQTAVSVYGHSQYYKAQGVLLGIENIKRDGYVYFDTFDDDEVRGGKRQFMLALLAPRINYLQSLRVKELFAEYALKIKEGKEWDIKHYWELISDILTTPTTTFI